MAMNLIAIAAGSLLILRRRVVAARPAWRRVPLLSSIDRAASRSWIVAVVGVAWIALGIWGLID
jgi:hypothetical protein